MITVKHDPDIKVPEIRVPIQEETELRRPEYVIGIISPLVSINGILVNFDDVEYLRIDASKAVPTIEFECNDYNGTIKKFEDVGKDNYIQIQVLPPFDDAYKKVNLIFYIENMQVGATISGRGSLKVPDFTKAQFECLGEVSTYELFSELSKKCKLGFASNIESTQDKRYINCNYKSYKELLSSEIELSESSRVMVLDWWLDLWHNIVLCDIYKRSSSTDNIEDMRVWISDGNENATSQIQPVHTDLVFNNSPASQNSELFIETLEPIKHTYKNLSNQQVSTIYSMDKMCYLDHQLGDSKHDPTYKYDYRGEIYGEYDYMFAKETREYYMRYKTAEQLRITTKTPLLGVNRGDQCRVVYYEPGTQTNMKRQDLEKLGLPKLDDLNLGWLKDYILEGDSMVLNYIHSGQYMVLGYTIEYSHGWNYTLDLIRVSPKVDIYNSEKEKEVNLTNERLDVQGSAPR